MRHYDSPPGRSPEGRPGLVRLALSRRAGGSGLPALPFAGPLAERRASTTVPRKPPNALPQLPIASAERLHLVSTWLDFAGWTSRRQTRRWAAGWLREGDQWAHRRPNTPGPHPARWHRWTSRPMRPPSPAG